MAFVQAAQPSASPRPSWVSLARPLEGLKPAPLVVPARRAPSEEDRRPAAGETAEGHGRVAGIERFVHVTNVPYATSHAEVCWYVGGNTSAGTLLRWEHTSSFRTDFVAEFSSVEAAEKAYHRVMSVGAVCRPKLAFLKNYTFAHQRYNADADAAPVVPSTTWNDFAVPPPHVLSDRRGTPDDRPTWLQAEDGIAYQVVTRDVANAFRTPEEVHRRAMAMPSRMRSSDAWLRGVIPPLGSGV